LEKKELFAQKHFLIIHVVQAYLDVLTLETNIVANISKKQDVKDSREQELLLLKMLENVLLIEIQENVVFTNTNV